MNQEVLGFIPPPDFPAELYESVRQCLNKYANTHKDQIHSFRMGWKGLAYHYRASIEYNEKFIGSIYISNNSPSREERYQQEKYLFGFFTNAVSVIDCFFFSIYCLASIHKEKEFPLLRDKDLKFYPNDVRSGFVQYFSNEELTNNLNKCLNSDMYKRMLNMRNVLSHRGTLSRSINVGGESDGLTTIPINPEAPSNQWQFNFSVDEKTTDVFRTWLSVTLKELVESSVDFCTQQLPKVIT